MPVLTDLPPAPDELLKIVRCNCHTDCSSMHEVHMQEAQCEMHMLSSMWQLQGLNSDSLEDEDLEESI